MTYNVFGGMLNLALSVYLSVTVPCPYSFCSWYIKFAVFVMMTTMMIIITIIILLLLCNIRLLEDLGIAVMMT